MIKKLMSAGVLSLAVLTSSMAFGGYPADTVKLKPKPVYGKEAKVVVGILDDNHYRRIKLNDSLSSVILDSYILSLDYNKTYFLAKDIASFDKYRKNIDDLTRDANVDIAYE